MKTLKRLNRKILDILSFSVDREEKIKESTTLASSVLGADVYFLDLNFEFVSKSNNDCEGKYFERFRNVDIQQDNVQYEGKIYMVTPLISSRENLGFLIAKKGTEFSEEEIIIFEHFKNLAIIALTNINRDRNFKRQRQQNIVRNSISSFSYSELHAIVSIFNELDGNEGVVVASFVSEKYSVTRSVIVSALRKFESSGVIESRSLGAKGTYIKVLNPFLLDELQLIKNDFLNKK